MTKFSDKLLIEVVKKIPKKVRYLLCLAMFITIMFGAINAIVKAVDNGQEEIVHDIESLESLLE